MQGTTRGGAAVGLVLSVGLVAAGCNLLTGAGDLEIANPSDGDGGTSAAATGSDHGTPSGATTGPGAGETGAGAGATAGPTSTGAGPAGAGGASTSSVAASTSAAQSSVAASTSSGQSNDAAQLCVDTINMYRATLGLPPYERWDAEEMCGDGQAESDSQTGQAHGAFGQCSENAQNECPGWPGPPEGMIGGCLQLMWAEGPGQDFNTHGHYINMSSTQYTKVACGFFTMANGDVWSVQDFK